MSGSSRIAATFGELEGEPLAVLVRPDGPDLRPEGPLAFLAVFHGKHFLGWLLPGFGLAGHDDLLPYCPAAHDARPCAAERTGRISGGVKRETVSQLLGS